MRRSGKKLVSLVLVVALLGAFFARMPVYAKDAGAGEKEAVKKALAYLRSVQNGDGGFPFKEGEASDAGTTSWVIIALGAAGEDVSNSWKKGGKSPLDYLKGSSFKPDSTTDYARTLLALAAAGEKPVYKGENLAEKLKSWIDKEGKLGQKDKGEDELINAHMWGILALISAGEKIANASGARSWLIKRQNPDGSFAWAEGIEGDADDTAAALQALIALGEDKNSPVIKKALGYIKSCQLDNGGFKSGWNISQANSSSDAWVIQALLAAGENVRSSYWQKNGKDAVSHLLSLQDKSGGFRWTKESPQPSVLCTAYALMALEGCYFPLKKERDVKGVFKDLPPSHWAYDAVCSLEEKGVLGGYPDNTFRPEKSLSRSEFARLLCAALNLKPAVNEGRAKFKDVPDGYWAKSYIETVSSYGYMRGYPDGSFHPEGRIKGSELAAVLCSMAGIRKDKDYPGEKWHVFYVEKAKEKGFLYPTFKAEEEVSRAGCAYSMEKLLRFRQGEKGS